MVVLLALTIVIKQKIKMLPQLAYALTGIAIMVIALFIFFDLRNTINKYTYNYPEDPACISSQNFKIRGDYNKLGIENEKSGKTTEEAISRNGGICVVLANQVLWTVVSRSAIVDKIIRSYAAIALLMTTSLYAVAIALWRSLPQKTKEKKVTNRPVRRKK